MSGEEENTQPPKKDGIIAGGSVLSGLAAFIGASCCVLPLILVNLGVSAAIVGKLAFFARAQQYFFGGAVLLIAGALIAAFSNGRKPSKRVSVMLILAAAFVVASYIMPFYEGQLLHWINQ